jgi:RND family efflux transporter MFP subunit
VRAAEDALRSAERKLREDRALARKGILSRAEVERSSSAVNARRSDRQNARAKLRMAETRLAQAKRDHADTVVRAPIDGQVTSVNIKVGEAPQDLGGLPVATIEDASELLAEVSAGESKIGLLRPGQEARIRVSGAGFGTDFLGHIVQIAPKAERAGAAGATRYTAKVALDKQDERLRPGMQVQVRVVTAEKATALTVPLSAVVTGGRSEHGMVERVAQVGQDGLVRWVPIQTDLVSTDRVEITAGPPEGAVVVSGPVERLLELDDGDEVRIIESR